MKWINPKYVTRSREEGDVILTDVFLGDPDDCVFGETVRTFDEGGHQVDLRFPLECSRLGKALLEAGNRFAYVADGDSLPYDDIAVRYNRLGRTYIIGRSDAGRFYIHCRLNNGHGFIAEV